MKSTEEGACGDCPEQDGRASPARRLNAPTSLKHWIQAAQVILGEEVQREAIRSGKVNWLSGGHLDSLPSTKY